MGRAAARGSPLAIFSKPKDTGVEEGAPAPAPVEKSLAARRICEVTLKEDAHIKSKNTYFFMHIFLRVMAPSPQRLVYVSLVLLGLTLLSWLSGTHWMAQRVSSLRERLAAGCARAPPQPSAPGRRPLRLLVCLSSGPLRAARFEHTVRVVAEYLAYSPSRYAVTVSVDTTDDAVAEGLRQRFPAAGAALQTTVWGTAQLERAFPASAGWGGEPAEFLVSHAHRLYMHARRAEFDLFAYTEDDMLLREAGVDMFLEHQQVLWAKGWLPGFVREEAAFESGEPTCSDLSLERLRVDGALRVYRESLPTPYNSTEGEPRAVRYASFADGPYSAVWVLTRAQLDAFVADPSRVYAAGYSEFDTRARMSWGYMFARTREGGLLPRVLVPLSGEAGGGDGGAAVDPRAHVLHLPSNYCGKNIGWGSCTAFSELQKVLADAPEAALAAHSALPCKY